MKGASKKENEDDPKLKTSEKVSRQSERKRE